MKVAMCWINTISALRFPEVGESIEIVNSDGKPFVTFTVTRVAKWERNPLNATVYGIEDAPAIGINPSAGIRWVNKLEKQLCKE